MAMDDSLFDSFRRTTYQVVGLVPRIDIRLGEHCGPLEAVLESRGARTWAFITAWNPGSVALPHDVNAVRQLELETELAKRRYPTIQALGVPSDESWVPEVSVLVIGIGEDEAAAIGRAYGQLAIVFGESGGSARLVPCTKITS